MKNYVLLLTALVLGTAGSLAATPEDKVVPPIGDGYGNSFIFVENGITFSVYPDGEFDFYIDERANYGASINTRHASITFNSGFDYDPYVQYDDYGAVIQVENVPIYYDYYGRVDQIGDVNIRYRNGRLYRLGSMHVFYNNNGYYDYHTGYINAYNRYYEYRPFHGYFARPALGFCLVFNRPYRQYYSPVRYTYYRPYRSNHRRAYARTGEHYTYNKANKRDQVYRNDKRVVARDNGSRRSEANRSNSSSATRSQAADRTSRTVSRSGDGAGSSNSVNRRSNSKSGTTVRSNDERSDTRRSSTTARSSAQKTETRSSDTGSGRSAARSEGTAAPKTRTTAGRTADTKDVRGQSTGRSVNNSGKSRQTSASANSGRSSGSGSTIQRSTAKQGVNYGQTRNSGSTEVRSRSNNKAAAGRTSSSGRSSSSARSRSTGVQ